MTTATTCSPDQAERILTAAGMPGPVTVERIKIGNDVFRLTGDAGTAYLKCHTKDWYGEPASTGHIAAREAAAWRLLERHAINAPRVLAVATDCANPLGRPFVLTLALPGRPLTEWLRASAPADRAAQLAATGAYLASLHAITFPLPGPMKSEDSIWPLNPPGQWNHRGWLATARQEWAITMLANEQARLPADLPPRLEREFHSMAARLDHAYHPPCFIHGDCHANQFHLIRDHAPDGPAAWRVTGVVDFEMASAGDPGEDLLKLWLELCPILDPADAWWHHLLAGYGRPVEPADLRLRLLGAAEVECWAAGFAKGRADILQDLLDATDWRDLAAIARKR